MRTTRYCLPTGALLWLVLLIPHGPLGAGPYSHALNDPSNSHDAPIPGFVGPDGEGKARLDDGQGGFENPDNYVNPLFFRWGLTVTDYYRSDGQAQFSDPSLALGPVTGDNFDVVSLGDLTAAQISGGTPVGRITTQFTSASQTTAIRNLPGADFVVFENGFLADFDTGGAGAGGVEGELAYVEVSSDGINFARFPSVSLTASAIGPYGTLDATNIFNLAGKHVNALGDSWGTPFDLSDLTNSPLVLNGVVDLNNIRHVRIVDIPGNGGYFDAATPTAHPIYDPWLTAGSGGFDLEAIGAISIPITFAQWQDNRGLIGAQRGASADPDQDGVPNLIEYSLAMLPTVSDVKSLPFAARVGNNVAISFSRDTRTTDVIVEVQGTSDLGPTWQPIARSTGGGDLVAVAPFSPVIDDASDSHIASVGVIRRETVHATGAIRFMKVSVTPAP